MDVRIGVTHAAKEIEIELAPDADREKIRKRIDEALSDEAKVLWLTDKSGRDVAVASAKIAYVELGGPDGERRIGFGAA
ncbi:MAG TPA: DUF3107 domain-containing protein [Acidimicrobiales bacterium]|nr:DUF3107 domain-containing protein [Acidimicrobiales bacterium]